MRSIAWSDEALDDFEEAISYIAGNSQASATLIADRVEMAVELLAEIPTGHAGRVPGTYDAVSV